MFASELKRLYQNTLVRWIFSSLLIGFVLLTANFFFGIENRSYKNELKHSNQLELIQNNYLSFQIEAYKSYHEDVEDKIENNKTKLMMSVFDDEVVRAQLEAENQTLEKIQAMNVQILPGYAITELLKSSLFSIFVLILCCISVYTLFFEDIIYQTIYLYKSTHRSLSRLFFVKVTVFLSVVLLFTVLSMSVVFLMTYLDGVDLLAPIQWIVDYRYNVYLFTILEQIIVLMLVQASAAICLGLLVLLLVIYFRNISIGYGLALLVLLVEFFLYSFTSISSSFTAFKYINFFYYLFGPINHLRWVTLANTMLDFILVSLIVAFVTAVTVVYTCRWFYTRLSSEFTHHKGKGFQIHSTNLIWHELLRTHFFSKAFVIVLLVLVYSLNRYLSFSVSKSQGQLDYEMIESHYYGELNNSTLDRITRDIEEAQIAQEMLESHFIDEQSELTQAEYEALDQKARPYPSLVMIKDKMSQLYTAGAKFFVDDVGYDYIFESKSDFSVMIHFILITIALSLFVAMNVHSEYQMKLTKLYDSTKNGHLRKQRIDLLLYFGTALLLVIIVYGLFVFKIQKGYPVFNQNLPLLALTSATSSSISLMSYTLLSFALHLFVYISIVRLVYVLSRTYDVAIVVVIMLGFALIQIALFSFLPALSVFHLLTISFVNQLWVSLAWVIVLIVLNSLMHTKYRIYRY